MIRQPVPRTVLAVLAASTIVVTTLPVASAEEITTCYAAPTDMTAKRIGLTKYFVSGEDGSVWEDTNGRVGIQKSADYCVVTDAYYKVLYSYQTRAADTRSDDAYAETSLSL